MSSLATGWSWLAMVLAVLPGLTNLKRMKASGGMERVARVLVGGDPSERRGAAHRVLCQISALTIPSRGSGWPAS
jgi:hypothetical protein